MSYAIFLNTFSVLTQAVLIWCLTTTGFFQNTGSNKGTPTRKPPDVKNLKLKGVDKKLAETILNEVIDSGPPVSFNDIGKLRHFSTVLFN